MNNEKADSGLAKMALGIYRFVRSSRRELAILRLKWQRPRFYHSLDFVDLILFVSEFSPFVANSELDAIISAHEGKPKVLEEHLKRGVNPDLKGLMEEATSRNHINIVNCLLEHGANPNRRLHFGWETPLHRAARIGNPEMIKALLNFGADPNLKDSAGSKPYAHVMWQEGVDPRCKELLEPVTVFDRPSYRIGQFLEMDDPVAAYHELCTGIRSYFHPFTATDLRILSIMEFNHYCLTRGYFDLMYDHVPWAIVPSAELLEAINEPVLAGMMRRCIKTVREFGKPKGIDPFAMNAEDLALDDETRAKVGYGSKDADFTGVGIDPDALLAKTMTYVRENQHLFP